MQTVEQWVEKWQTLTDAKEKEAFIKSIPNEFQTDERIKEIVAWWNVRYFYVDRAQTRLGDKFVWFYLSMRGQQKSRVGQKEALRIYKEIFESSEGIDALGYGQDELVRQLDQAATLYVDTIGEPPPLLGLIPMKDKTPNQRLLRVAKIIVQEHFLTAWAIHQGLEHLDLVMSSLYDASLCRYDGIGIEINREVEQTNDDGFKAWVNCCIDTKK